MSVQRCHRFKFSGFACHLQFSGSVSAGFTRVGVHQHGDCSAVTLVGALPKTRNFKETTHLVPHTQTLTGPAVSVQLSWHLSVSAGFWSASFVQFVSRMKNVSAARYYGWWAVYCLLWPWRVLCGALEVFKHLYTRAKVCCAGHVLPPDVQADSSKRTAHQYVYARCEQLNCSLVASVTRFRLVLPACKHILLVRGGVLPGLDLERFLIRVVGFRRGF